MPATIYLAKDNSAVDLRKLTGVTVLVTVPAAFSGTCTSACVPAVVENCMKIKKAGADHIFIVSADQPFALNEWVKAARWPHEEIEFASDFGSFELRTLIGKLSGEKGKENVPPPIGELLRRSYSILKDGKVVWQFIEPDSTKFTLRAEDLVLQVRKAKGN